MRVRACVWLLVLGALLGCAERVTFSKDIAPILQAKCQSCHRPGQIAPMSLLTYREVRPFAELIRLSVYQGNMPPFYATGPLGYFKQDVRLSEAEKQLIYAWADAGAPEGDLRDLPEPLEWETAEWPLGEPDLILSFPKHSPPAVFEDQFVTLVSGPAFAEDIWARALSLKTNSKDVVHHSAQFLWGPGLEVPPGGKSADHIVDLYSVVFTWLPGLGAVSLPKGQALRLPKGHRMAAHTHFAPTREDVSEELQLGVYFADGEIESLQKAMPVVITRIMIPPGERHYELKTKETFVEDALVTHFNVHMHLRGKESKVLFHYPDGSSETVFDLPRFRFEWQRHYYLAEPKHVPKGTVAEFIGVWDNSADNKSNPDPDVWCRYGPKTTDEMFGSTVYYTPSKKLAVPLRIENGRRIDDVGVDPVTRQLL